MVFGILHLRISGILFILRNKKRSYLVELGGIALHLIFYSLLVFSILGLSYGLLLIILHHIFQGLYIAVNYETPFFSNSLSN